jgi:pimeloyl-ACP methyl ester carboxylesterase
MPTRRNVMHVASAAVAGTLAASVLGAETAGAAPRSGVKPVIVLVHGAWADASSWSAVAALLQKQGYTVFSPPNPLRGVADDARTLRDFLTSPRVTGLGVPVVLAAHSYGGMVVTAAASGNAGIKALVYVDAYIPQAGDSVLSLTSAQPGSTLDPATTVDQVFLHDAAGNVIGADLYVKPASFPSIFAGGIPAATAATLGAGQRPLSAAALTEPFAGTPAWTSIPSWAVVGTADQLLPPAEQQIMATRAGACVVKVKAPHLSMVAEPHVVAGVIGTAAARR